jgi:hypothetical protein
MMQRDGERLREIADTVAAGGLRSTIAEVTNFTGLAAAIERNKLGHAPGKTVLDLTR